MDGDAVDECLRNDGQEHVKVAVLSSLDVGAYISAGHALLDLYQRRRAKVFPVFSIKPAGARLQAIPSRRNVLIKRQNRRSI